MDKVFNIKGGMQLWVFSNLSNWSTKQQKMIEGLLAQEEELELEAMLENKVPFAEQRVLKPAGALEELTGTDYHHLCLTEHGTLKAMRVTDVATIEGMKNPVLMEYWAPIMTKKVYLRLGILGFYYFIARFDDHIYNREGIAAYLTDGLGARRFHLFELGYQESNLKVSVPPLVITDEKDWEQIHEVSFFAWTKNGQPFRIAKKAGKPFILDYIKEGYLSPVEPPQKGQKAIRTPPLEKIPAVAKTMADIDALRGKYITFRPISLNSL